MPDRYRVVVTPGAETDIIDLPTTSLKQEALRLILSLRDDPYLGEELRARPNIQVLFDCRKIRFDDPSRPSRVKKLGPRYRIVYRNEPEGAPQQISILAVARREDLDAYRRAASRLSKHMRSDR